MPLPRSTRAVLVPLFAIQFLSWSGMFCLWIYAVPVIARLPSGDPHRTLVVVSACFALYAVLGATLAFALPAAMQRFGVGATYGLAQMIGAAGLATLGIINRPILLIPAFAAIGVAWSCVSNIPYAIAGAAAPPGKGAEMLRLFAFSTVLPQVVTSLLLASVASEWLGDAVKPVMLAGGLSMALGGLLALVWRDRFTVAPERW